MSEYIDISGNKGQNGARTGGSRGFSFAVSPAHEGVNGAATYSDGSWSGAVANPE